MCGKWYFVYDCLTPFLEDFLWGLLSMKCAVVIQLWKCFFCSLVFNYLTPLFPNTFHSSPLTLAPLHPLQVLLIDMLHLAFSGGRIENSTKLMVVCLIGQSIECIPVISFKHCERRVSLYPKVRYHQSYLLTDVGGRSYLALCFDIGVCGMMHLGEGNSWMVVHTLLQAFCTLIWPSLIHKLTCLINCFSLV